MNHMCGRISKDLSVFNKPFKTTNENDCSVNRSTADCKIKRLRKRKERSQMRHGGEKASKTKSHHHHHCPSRKDMPHFHNCCHGNCPCPSRREAPFQNVVPATQEPSIITESRLIGHHGLFNHEVKSIDIERLLTEQRKLEKGGKHMQKKIIATSGLPSTSHIPSPFSSNDLFGDDADEVVPFKKKADLAKNTHCQKKEKEVLESESPETDVTPRQSQQCQHDHSSGSCQSDFLPKHKSKKANSVMSEEDGASHLTPTGERVKVETQDKKVKGQTLSTPEHIPKSQGPPVHQRKAHSLSSSPLQLSSSPTAGASGNVDIQHGRNDLDCVSKSISAVAARLCHNLQFPIHKKKRNLLSECREVLLKALQERHGPWLQENLLEVQQCLSFGSGHARAVPDQNQRPTLKDEDGPWSTDTFPAEFHSHASKKSCFGSHKTTAVTITGSKYFKWNISPKPHQSWEQTARWSTSPMKTSDRFYDILRPSSPQLCMDFEPTRASSGDHLFAPSDSSCWAETTSGSQDWEDSFNWPKTKESVMFDSFENSFMNHNRPTRKGSSGLQYSEHNIQPIFPNQAQLHDRHSAKPRQFPQEHGTFETENSSFATAFSAQVHQSKWSNFQPHHPHSCFSHTSNYSDMMNYPPSHMHERDTAPLPCSFLSPEHWSFPPMKLY